jgi:O-antigen ligase
MNSTHTQPAGNKFWALVPLWLLCFIAISPSLGTAVAAIGRLLLYLMALVVFVWRIKASPAAQVADPRKTLSTLILVTCVYMALTISWSQVEIGSAMISWSRHARLLTIPILYYLLRDSVHARIVLKAYTYAQVFVVLSSWLLVFGIRAPWVTAAHYGDLYAVFGSYLEQSISQAVLVALLWYQRGTIFGKIFGTYGKYVAVGIAATTLIHTVVFLPGRSGHLVAVGLITLACVHAIPKRYKWSAVLVPFLALAMIVAVSSNFRTRMMLISSDITAYTRDSNANSSSGERIVYWQTSLKAIAERPILGFGVGSWNHEYRRLEGGRAIPGSLNVDNPHQLLLLWLVEAGIVGLALLCAVLVSLWLYSRKLAVADALSLQAIVAALAISGMFNSMIYGIGMGDFFCVGLGILASMPPLSDKADLRGGLDNV